MKANQLRLKPLGIDTRNEHTVYMRKDCPVCISEGYEALTRIRISHGYRTIVASLNILTNDSLLSHDELGLSKNAINALEASAGDLLTLSHLHPIDSMSAVRSKIYGHRLNEEQLDHVVKDIVKGNYSNVEIAAFLTACAGERMDIDEIIHLTRAMINAGQRLHWPQKQVYDKHCIGGLPGNRTTPIVVAIVAAFGLTIPKTSSRAITSPAGTADAMECVTPVNLSIDQMRKVVEQENGCLVWGGSVSLSPADDILIRVERALDIDSEGQLIASVLSKKAAAGSTHIVIDIPVGTTAKVRTTEDAEALKARMTMVAEAIGVSLKVILTDGTQPVGRGIGPALEALDVLSVLRNEPNAPTDLRSRSLELAGALLELSGKVAGGRGNATSTELLRSGKALEKFMAICNAQGGFREPRPGEYRSDVLSHVPGTVMAIDNRKIARLAKLAGAPNDPGAGVQLLTPLNSRVSSGTPLFSIYAESKGELDYALEYYEMQTGILSIE